MKKNIYLKERLSKFVIYLRIQNLRAYVGLSIDIPFDWCKEKRDVMVSYHNQLIVEHNVNMNIFEMIR
jgi:hypothetical protein